MSRLAITLEDVDGSVQANVVWEDGFDKDSNAHQVAKLILDHMDSIMERYAESNVASEVVAV
jgi:hypothetical protein